MEELRKTEGFLCHLGWELFSGRKGLNDPYGFPGGFPEWDELFNAFEKYGTIENIMELYMDIAALYHKILSGENVYSFFGSGSSGRKMAQEYFLKKIAPFFSGEIFKDSYIGEKMKNKIDKFVEKGDDFIVQDKLVNKIRLKMDKFHNHEYTDMLEFEKWYENMWHFGSPNCSNDGFEDSNSDFFEYFG